MFLLKEDCTISTPRGQLDRVTDTERPADPDVILNYMIIYFCDPKTRRDSVMAYPEKEGSTQCWSI